MEAQKKNNYTPSKMKAILAYMLQDRRKHVQIEQQFLRCESQFLLFAIIDNQLAIISDFRLVPCFPVNAPESPREMGTFWPQKRNFP